MKRKARRSCCPVACSLDIVGDKWSMIVVRDLFLGVTRFTDFLRSPERITTSILTERLQHLEEEGIITKTAYQQRPVRWEYRLTPKGRDLAPMMKAMVEWARAWQAEVIRAPFPDDLVGTLVGQLTPDQGKRTPARGHQKPATARRTTRPSE